MPHHLVRPKVGQLRVIQADPAAATGTHQTEDRLEDRGFARAVGADNADDLSGRHLHRHAMQDRQSAIARLQIFDA